MKTAVKHSFIFFFITAFLVCSFRITVNKMQCLGSGKVTYSLSKAEDCCPVEEKKGTSADADCCEFSKITFQAGITDLSAAGNNFFRWFYRYFSSPFGNSKTFSFKYFPHLNNSSFILSSRGITLLLFYHKTCGYAILENK
jgi:hypothetical protein